MNRTVQYKKRAFSIAEIVVSMALILIMTAAGFTVCYVGLGIQNNTQNYMSIRNMSDNIRVAFETSLSEVGISSEEDDKKEFLTDFNNRIAFTLNSWVPDLRGFTGERSLDGDSWEINVILEEQTDVVDYAEKTTVVKGLDLKYSGADSTGPTYTFEYRYFTGSVEIITLINVRSGNYYLTVRGYRAGSSNVSYELAEVYS